ncbi:MAG: hypothetical protein QME94_03695, partial [Anaerolineae bacterium]|nr:hypothetical protein [Anaerolineae bacterium]
MVAKQWPRRLAAYLAWAVLLMVALWLLVLGREVFLGVLATLYAGDSPALGRQVGFLEKMFVLGAGLLWIAFMVLSEAYLEAGARRGRLRRHLARIAGPQLLLLGAVDLSLLLLQGASAWLRWLILGLEVLLG